MEWSVLALQAGLLATVLEGARRRDAAATVNAVVSFGVAVVPTTVELAAGVDLPLTLPVWVGVAGLLHTVGMLGLYESRWWWDHLTHTISAAFVTALLYATLVVVGLDGFVLAGTTLGATMVAGVVWELLELVARDIGQRFDVTPVLVYYGPRDTLADLGFDALGALVVVAVDLRVFVTVFEPHPAVSRTLLLLSGAVTAVSGVAMAGFLYWSAGDAGRSG